MLRSLLRLSPLLAALVSPTLAIAQSPHYEAQIDSILRARDPRAESLFFAGNAALAEERYSDAALQFTSVLKRVPDFAPATRRLAYAQIWLGNRSVALALMEELMSRDSTAFTRCALARALVEYEERTPPSPADLERARAQVEAAIAEAPDEISVWRTAVQVARTDEHPDTALYRRAAQALVRLQPDEWRAWADLAEWGLVADKLEVVPSALDRARKLGLPPDVERSLMGFESVRRTEHNFAFARWTGISVVVVWITALAALFGVGTFLSNAALRAAGRTLTSPTGSASGLDERLRLAYRLVLWGSGAFFYASMPLLLVIVIAMGGGLVYLFFALGHVPIKLVLVIVLVTGITVLAIVRGLFRRYHDGDPGERADLATQPRLREVLDQVAGLVGTRPVDTVFLTPGTEIAVFERGDMRRQLQGTTERCLILGIGVLEGMTLRQFRSILAHEYGHFSNRDTAGGGLALSVRRSLMSIAIGIAEGGAAAWYNPAWWFVKVFHAVFMRISQGASRLQEVLADRWAASTYGSLAFEHGLMHVISTSIRFDSHANRAIREALREQKPLVNLYRYRPAADPVGEVEAEGEIRRALDAEPSPYDSHPAPRQRLDWVRGYNSAGESPRPDDAEPAWSLLEGREALEEFMTARVRSNVESLHEVKFASG